MAQSWHPPATPTRTASLFEPSVVGQFLLDAAVPIGQFGVMKRNVARPDTVRRSDTVPNPNEIARRIDGLRERAADGAKVALKAMLEISKLLRVMVDVHG